MGIDCKVWYNILLWLYCQSYAFWGCVHYNIALEKPVCINTVDVWFSRYKVMEMHI